MKRGFPGLLLSLLLLSCAPVISPEVMNTAAVNPPYAELRGNPGVYEGKLFVLGGIIVETRVVARGSLIEAAYLPVDSRGRLTDTRTSPGRFLALYPKEAGLLDPLIYRNGRLITVAGYFTGLETKLLGDMEYVYPAFSIREIYLWEEWREAYYYAPYPYWWYGPWPVPWWYAPRWRYYWW